MLLRILMLSRCYWIFLPTSSVLWQLIASPSVAVNPDDKKSQLMFIHIEWLMMIKSFLNLAQVYEITTASRSSQINVLFTGSVLRICDHGHSIMDSCTLVHAINPLQADTICHCSSSSKPSMAFYGSYHN